MPSAARIMASHHGNHPTPRSLDKQGRGERRDKGMACGSARCLTHRASLPPCCSSCPSPSRRISPAGAFHPGKATIPGEPHIFRAVFLSSSYPPRLIASSVPRLSVPSGQASRQVKTAGVHRRPSVPSSHPRPGPSSPRLVPRVARAGRMASRSRRSVRLAGPVFPSP